MGKLKPECRAAWVSVFRSFSLLQPRTHCPMRERPAVGDTAGVSVLSAGLWASHKARWSCQLCPTDVLCWVEGFQGPSTLLPAFHPSLHPPAHPPVCTADQTPTPLLTYPTIHLPSLPHSPSLYPPPSLHASFHLLIPALTTTQRSPRPTRPGAGIALNKSALPLP